DSIDATRIGRIDAAGALLLMRAAERLGLALSEVRMCDDQRSLFDVVAETRGEGGDEPRREPGWFQVLAHVGESVTGLGEGLRGLVGFLGLTLSTLAATVWRPATWRVTSTVHHMERTGLDALGLVALLTFLVGAVVAYLGATVLRDFGAELFVVDLITYAFFREFGILLAAILLAGRTASAFTAQIGTMKAREEIDAMRTIGLDPIVLLVLPRLLALMVMLPILGAIATLSGLLGGMLVATLSLGIEPEMFITRVQETLALRHYLVGLAKAPLFATVIALVGCLEGFKVSGTAQSVGEHTTSAVVQSISLVIVIDALAAVFFMEMGW
ncbi:MAG: MlaE family ABC transporter permease, partial [Wenzhouxiangella sp.]